MPNIQFETGIQEYSLNGKVSVFLNPTDTNFAERMFNTIDELDALQSNLDKRLEEAEGGEIFAIMREINDSMREKIDGLFGTPICESLFGNTNIYALAEGLPIWANLLFAIVDIMLDSYTAEQKKINPRIEKYTKKYHN